MIAKEDFLGKLWQTINSVWVWVWLGMSVALTVIDGMTRGDYWQSALVVFPLSISIMTVIYALLNWEKLTNV